MDRQRRIEIFLQAAHRLAASLHQPHEYPSKWVLSSGVPLTIGTGPVTWFWT